MEMTEFPLIVFVTSIAATGIASLDPTFLNRKSKATLNTQTDLYGEDDEVIFCFDKNLLNG